MTLRCPDDEQYFDFQRLTKIKTNVKQDFLIVFLAADSLAEFEPLVAKNYYYDSFLADDTIHAQ